jgi:hypothetical protein
MSGVAPCAPPGVTGTLVTTAALCDALDAASKVDLKLPEVTPPTPLTDSMMPAALKKAMTDCTGTSSCKFIGYDFDSDLATPASASPYVVDTYSTTVENSGVLVSKGKKTSGTVSGVTPDATTGGSTGTVMYTANGQTYTFQGKWRSVQTSGVSVDVYFDPTNMSKGALRPEDLGFTPPTLVQPPGYELPDFQAASTTPSNLISRPDAASVEECAKKCDETDTCTGFNFGGLDISSVCELVKDTTTNRAYADGMSGFRKETISRTQTGDGSNPSGTDLTNEGVYCRDAPACNTDIARIITENVGATNPIAALSTSDIESCAYCPIRTYATAGNVTTNEIGVSKSNPTPAAAIAEIQYSSDGTSATHLTLVNGGTYNVKQFVPSVVPTGGQSQNDRNVIAVSNPDETWYFLATGTGVGGDISDYIYGQTTNNKSIILIPVDYVTNGFRFINQEGKILLDNSDSKYSKDYNTTIFVFSPITFSVFMSGVTGDTYGKYKNQSILGRPTTQNPYIYKKPNGDIYKIDINTGKASKFSESLILQWYIELNPSWNDWVNGFYVNSWIAYEQAYVDVFVRRDITISNDIFWNTVITYDNDVPDPYAALGQFRTLDVAPPSTAQSWAYNLRQGCDKNCGNVTNGYAIYRCTPGGVNCDPGKGATFDAACAGTHISCRPGDDSTDLKNQFSFKFRGLLPASSKVTAGGSNSDHDTDALRVRTIYSLDSTFSVTTTPNESIQKIYSIFPSFVVDRILRTPNLASLVPAALCPPGTYVRDYGFGLKACETCPGNPTLASNQVFQPDTVNPGNFMCTVTTCPTGQQRDLLTNRCRIPCLPGQFVSSDGTCATCPDQTLAGNQYWMPDITNVGSYTCVKNQCTGNQYPYVNGNKSGCRNKCFPGYGPDPANPGQCTLCTVTPTRLQKWVYETLGSVGGEVISFTCDLTTCPDGQYPFLSSAGRECTPCAQPIGLPSSVTATFGQGCAVKACSVDPNSPNVASATLVPPDIIPPANCLETGGCTTVGSCALVCKTGFTGASCTPCPQPPGIKATYSTACIATSCSVDTSSPDASKVSGATVINGNCIASCNPGFWKYLEYGCYACGALTGDDPLTTRTYSQNSCNPASCTVDSSLVGKATAAPATVPGYPNVSVCMLTPAKGYMATSSTSVTGDYISIAGPFDFRTMSFTRSAASTISACPAGDAGTTYTYSSGCSLATCSYTNPNDANETATPAIGSDGITKCRKVCKSGFKRDASGKCTLTCPAMSDPGLTVTFGPYGCKISACTSSSGFPTNITPVGPYGSEPLDACAIMCPAGARQYTNTNASPNRQDCSKCTTDLSINPWIFSSTCALVSNYCSLYGTINQRKLWSPGDNETTATATQSGSTCKTTCNSGYVKDSFGVCRKCPNETPSSTSAVVNGVCVTTCKANHTRDVTYDGKEFNDSTEQRFDPLFGVNGRTSTAGQLNQAEIVCPQCINGTTWDTASMKCINCSQASTASTKITPNCNQFCNAGYYFNKSTGVCDTCTAGSYCGGGGGTAVNPIIQCPAGTYCPAGSTGTTQCSTGYSCPAGSGSQTQCTVTPATGYIWANPTVDCTTKQCSAGYYCPNGITQTACATGKYCPAGSSAESACPSGSYCSTPATSATCSTTACGSGTWQSASCSSTSDRVCTTCRLPCVYAGGEYEASPCTPTADRKCGTCSTSCPAGQWKSAACSNTADRVCSPCTTCSTGQWQTADCSSTSDRKCKTCSTCPAGQYQSATCTATADTTCLGCSACGANSTRTGCGGTSPGSCVCNSGYTDFGSGVCYKMATSTTTTNCPSGMTLSGTVCKSVGTVGPCIYNSRSGCQVYKYLCPSGATTNSCTSNNFKTLCCSAPSTTTINYSCPSGGTPTIHGSNYYCV